MKRFRQRRPVPVVLLLSCLALFWLLSSVMLQWGLWRHDHSPLPLSPPRSSDRQHVAIKDKRAKQESKILTIYSEPRQSLDTTTLPLPNRTTTASDLKVHAFPNRVVNCSASVPLPLPIDDFPEDDPYLPWLHDYFVRNESVHVIAQNKRRCETGDGKKVVMHYWEPQVALFQGVPVQPLTNGRYRLDTTPKQTDHSQQQTRFQCHFHNATHAQTTLSQFPFNYEYILWRKHKLPMFQTTGKDVATFEVSQLLFECPIPTLFRQDNKNRLANNLYLDLVPIRTPARLKPLLTPSHISPAEYEIMHNDHALFDSLEQFGDGHILPAIQDSGRWANLPLCPAPKAPPKQYNFVGCTWTSSRYQRRGDATTIQDSALRLREWIIFHQLAGMDHIYLYDNTQSNQSELFDIVAEFPDFVTYHPWPAQSCSNNRPNFKNPGERSSQYAVDAACRTRYGGNTEWMSFFDTDEYLVPMTKSWRTLLDQLDDYDVLHMRSSRGRPRIDLMEELSDPEQCKRPNRRKLKLPLESCVIPRRNETFLRVYNCDYIRHPRPSRFERARKQIFRPAKVLSHFVHYSIVTTSIAKYYSDYDNPRKYRRSLSSNDYHDKFLDELTEGALLHAKSLLPHETMTRSSTCYNASKHVCVVGHACPDTTAFDDSKHKDNIFHDENGKYCNCWIDNHVENYWVPLLEKALSTK